MFLPKCIKIHSTKPEIAHFCAISASLHIQPLDESLDPQLSHKNKIPKLLNFVVTFFFHLVIPENDYECVFFRRICDHVCNASFHTRPFSPRDVVFLLSSCLKINSHFCEKKSTLIAKSEKIKNWNAIIFFSYLEIQCAAEWLKNLKVIYKKIFFLFRHHTLIGV